MEPTRRAPVVAGVPVVGAGASASSASEMADARARPGRARGDRGRDRRGRVTRSASSAPRRSGWTARDIQPPGDEPGRANLPRLPAARRARLAAARPGRRARRAGRGRERRSPVTEPASLTIGDLAPPLELPDTDGHADDAAVPGRGTGDGRRLDLQPLPLRPRMARSPDGRRPRRTPTQGVRILHVNSNDAERKPADSYEAMKERVEVEDWPCPYLHDASQDAARAWGAADHARRVRARLRPAAALPRGARRRLRRSLSGGGVAARRPRRCARGRRPGSGRDQPGRLLREVEGVAAP